MKIPRPSRPNAVLSAESSNSPTIRGLSRRAASQKSNRWRIAELDPGISIGAPSRFFGKRGPSVLLSLGAQKKLIGDEPSSWLNALTLRVRLIGSSAITRSTLCTESWPSRSSKWPSWQISRTAPGTPSAGSSRR